MCYSPVTALLRYNIVAGEIHFIRDKNAKHSFKKSLKR